MHDAVKNQDCFDCHIRGEKLRQKGGIPKEKHEAFLKQRLADPRCTRCHGKKKSEVSKEGEAKHPVPLSGRTFCPKCQVIGDKDWKMCPKCGGPLIDLDRIMSLNQSRTVWNAMKDIRNARGATSRLDHEGYSVKIALSSLLP
jgi:hypothetical protein